MFIKIWDKKEQINGVSSDEVFKSMPFLNGHEDIILISDNNSVVKRIEVSDVLKENLNLDKSLNALEVGELYLNYIEEQNKQAEENTKKQEQEKQSQEERIKQLENTILELKEVI